jgi:predicted HTH transcriptional regulator
MILTDRSAARAIASTHLNALPAPMRHCLEWAVRTTRVTAARAATELGHDQEVAHALLAELVTRGFVHRKTHEGETVFEVMRHVTSAKVHLWHRARTAPENQ